MFNDSLHTVLNVGNDVFAKTYGKVITELEEEELPGIDIGAGCFSAAGIADVASHMRADRDRVLESINEVPAVVEAGGAAADATGRAARFQLVERCLLSDKGRPRLTVAQLQSELVGPPICMGGG